MRHTWFIWANWDTRVSFTQIETRYFEQIETRAFHLSKLRQAFFFANWDSRVSFKQVQTRVVSFEQIETRYFEQIETRVFFWQIATFVIHSNKLRPKKSHLDSYTVMKKVSSGQIESQSLSFFRQSAVIVICDRNSGAAAERFSVLWAVRWLNAVYCTLLRCLKSNWVLKFLPSALILALQRQSLKRSPDVRMTQSTGLNNE